MKACNLQSNCQLNYTVNWLKDPFYYSIKYTLSTYCFKEIYMISLFPLKSNTDFSFLCAATPYCPPNPTPSLILLVHKFNSSLKGSKILNKQRTAIGQQHKLNSIFLPCKNEASFEIQIG